MVMAAPSVPVTRFYQVLMTWLRTSLGSPKNGLTGMTLLLPKNTEFIRISLSGGNVVPVDESGKQGSPTEQTDTAVPIA